MIRRSREVGCRFMNSKDTSVLKKIYQHTVSIMKYCQDCHSLQEFEDNPMRVEATVFNLMQIGELAKSELSDELKQRLTTIPWKQIYGMRNRIVHGYSGVNMQIVWDTVSEDIPALSRSFKDLLQDK